MRRIGGGDIAQIQCPRIRHTRTNWTRRISSTDDIIVIVDGHFWCWRCRRCGTHPKIGQVRLMIETDVRMVGGQWCGRRHRCRMADLRNVRQRCVIVIRMIGMVHMQMAIVILIVHRRIYCTDLWVHGQIQWILISNAYRFLLLPNEHVVDHRAATEDDSDADQNAGDDCWRRMELGEGVQNYTCGK